MEHHSTSDHGLRDGVSTDASRLSAVLVALTVLSSFVPIWINYASIWLLPGCIGWFVTLISLPAVWNGRRWGSYFAIAGSVLLLRPDLVLPLWGGVTWVGRGGWFFLEFRGVLIILAFLFATATAVVLALRLRAAKPPTPHECPGCGYDLQGLPASTRCPECGCPPQPT